MNRFPQGCLYAFTLSLSCCLCFGQFEPVAQTVSNDPNDWPMYNHDSLGTRFNSAESALSTKTATRPSRSGSPSPTRCAC